MRKTALIGFAILVLAALATSVLPAFADSTEPRPGYTYYIVYNQTDGSIVAAVGCPPSPAYCIPKLQPGQSVIYITDQPIVVNLLFADAHNAKLGNWHVNPQTHQLVSTSTTGSVTTAHPAFGIGLIGVALPALGFLGLATSSSLIWRRAHKRG